MDRDGFYIGWDGQEYHDTEYAAVKQERREESYRKHLCREHGMCSDHDCSEPIIGWEEREWGRKLCEEHLRSVERRGELTYRPEKWAADVIQAKAIFGIE